MTEIKKKIFFFSDLHLGNEHNQEHRDVKFTKLDLLFQKVAEEGSHLYMLGDIFDFWFEYKNCILSDGYKLLHKVSNLIDKGIKIDFISGNHDFWGGNFLESIGWNVHKKPIIRELSRRKVLLAHGDGLAPSDWGYSKILKPILRNRLNIFLFRQFHPDFAVWMGNIVSGGSRKMTADRKFPFMDEYIDFVKSQIDSGFDAVIIGHTHIAEIKKISSGFYVNTGNFFEDYSYVVLDENGFSVERI